MKAQQMLTVVANVPHDAEVVMDDGRAVDSVELRGNRLVIQTGPDVEAERARKNPVKPIEQTAPEQAEQEDTLNLEPEEAKA